MIYSISIINEAMELDDRLRSMSISYLSTKVILTDIYDKLLNDKPFDPIELEADRYKKIPDSLVRDKAILTEIYEVIPKMLKENLHLHFKTGLDFDMGIMASVGSILVITGSDVKTVEEQHGKDMLIKNFDGSLV